MGFVRFSLRSAAARAPAWSRHWTLSSTFALVVTGSQRARSRRVSMFVACVYSFCVSQSFQFGPVSVAMISLKLRSSRYDIAAPRVPPPPEARRLRVPLDKSRWSSCVRGPQAPVSASRPSSPHSTGIRTARRLLCGRRGRRAEAVRAPLARPPKAPRTPWAPLRPWAARAGSGRGFRRSPQSAAQRYSYISFTAIGLRPRCRR